jgi:AraC-like DNA-binding protein
MNPLLQPFPMEHKRRAQAWRYQPEFRRPRHFHDQSELNLVTRGVGRFVVGNNEIALGAGQVIGFLPGCEHELVAASEDLELFAIGFEPDLVQAYRRESGEALSFAGGPTMVAQGELARIREFCVSVDESRDRLALESKLLAVAASITRQPRSMPLGWRAADAIATDPERTREQLTQMLRSNRGDVSRALHRDVGTTLPALKNRVRVLNFVRRLDAGLSMTTAARLAGFGSYSQFHRAFVQLFDLSPREFMRSQVRNELAQRFEPFDDLHPASGVMTDARSDSAGFEVPSSS